LLEPLLAYLPALEASELRFAVTAATAPHTKPADYRSLMRSLGYLAGALDPPPPPEPPRVYQEVDREKARAWFEQQSVKIVPKEGL
jgi:hypothetical protein